ncbi:hypothetical protein V8E53_004928 [Lactarius tabidus]
MCECLMAGTETMYNTSQMIKHVVNTWPYNQQGLKRRKLPEDHLELHNLMELPIWRAMTYDNGGMISSDTKVKRISIAIPDSLVLMAHPQRSSNRLQTRASAASLTPQSPQKAAQGSATLPEQGDDFGFLDSVPSPVVGIRPPVKKRSKATSFDLIPPVPSQMCREAQAAEEQANPRSSTSTSACPSAQRPMMAEVVTVTQRAKKAMNCLSLSDDGKSERLPPRGPPSRQALADIRNLESPNFCRNPLSTPDEIFAEVLEILEEEMAHLSVVRKHINEAGDSLHRTILVLRNIKGNIIPFPKKNVTGFMNQVIDMIDYGYLYPLMVHGLHPLMLSWVHLDLTVIPIVAYTMAHPPHPSKTSKRLPPYISELPPRPPVTEYDFLDMVPNPVIGTSTGHAGENIGITSISADPTSISDPMSAGVVQAKLQHSIPDDLADADLPMQRDIENCSQASGHVIGAAGIDLSIRHSSTPPVEEIFSPATIRKALHTAHGEPDPIPTRRRMFILPEALQYDIEDLEHLFFHPPQSGDLLTDDGEADEMMFEERAEQLYSILDLEDLREHIADANDGIHRSILIFGHIHNNILSQTQE